MHLIRTSCWDFHFFTIICHAGEGASRPREGASPHAPLAEVSLGACYFAGDTEG